jgi:hypothetical protein
MLEVAIVSLKCALREDYPEFMEFYEQKPWIKKAEEPVTEAAEEPEETKEEVVEKAEEAPVSESENES